MVPSFREMPPAAEAPSASLSCGPLCSSAYRLVHASAMCTSLSLFILKCFFLECNGLQVGERLGLIAGDLLPGLGQCTGKVQGEGESPVSCAARVSLSAQASARRRLSSPWGLVGFQPRQA